MSTNCNVAIENEDGSITATYIHWDGYIADGGVGAMLLDHYKSEEKAKELANLGYVSELCPTISETVEKAREYKGGQVSRRYKDIWEFMDMFKERHSGLEYLYLFAETKIHMKSCGKNSTPYIVILDDGVNDDKKWFVMFKEYTATPISGMPVGNFDYKTEIHKWMSLDEGYIHDSKKTMDRYRESAIKTSKEAIKMDRYSESKDKKLINARVRDLLNSSDRIMESVIKMENLLNLKVSIKKMDSKVKRRFVQYMKDGGEMEFSAWTNRMRQLENEKRELKYLERRDS
jgi:hypothetical protein